MKIITTPDTLEIRLHGMERVWSLRSWVFVPRSYIQSVTWHPKYIGKASLWRIAGTGAPGVLYAGYFRGQGHTQFLYVKRPKGLLRFSAKNILEVQTKNFRFNRLLLSLTPTQAKRVQKWWAEN